MTTTIMRTATPTQIVDVPCAGCGCVCDDLIVERKIGGNPTVQRACCLGTEWFSETFAADAPVAIAHHQPVELDTAVAEAAAILSQARSPLIWGLTYTTCEAQRQAVSLAERLGAVIDPLGVARGSHGTPLQNLGMATATFGELRHRADVILLWNCDPATTHPRFFERYAPAPRKYIVVTDRPNATDAMPTAQQIVIKSGAGFVAANTLRAILRGTTLPAEPVLSETGAALTTWQELATQLKGARYGAIVLSTGDEAVATESLVRLVRELNEHARFVMCKLTPGNAKGAENVLTWRTGFPCCVRLARGESRFDPLQLDAGRLLERGEVDAVVIVADDVTGRMSDAALQRLKSLPVMIVDSRPNPLASMAAVCFQTARPGVECGGAIFRSDGVPLRLRPPIDTARPSDEAVLRLLLERLPARDAG